MKVSRTHYYRWKPRYDKDGIDGLRTPKSHAPQNPQTIDPQIEQRIIELKREHPKWGKKRIAQWIWKEHSWEKVVAVNTVRNVLRRHGLWRNEKRKKTRKNKGVTAGTPGKTINIDLCFVPAEESKADTPAVSFFFPADGYAVFNEFSKRRRCYSRYPEWIGDIFQGKEELRRKDGCVCAHEKFEGG